MPTAQPLRFTDTYRPPRTRLGAILFCRARRCRVAVVGFSNGPIRWPVGRPVAGERRGSAGLVVCGGLAAALRREQVQAVARWWGVSPATIAHWRAALGLGPSPTIRAKVSAAARARVSGSLPNGRGWTAAEDQAVRHLPPREAAGRTGRPVHCVYQRRYALGVSGHR
jgi:hypothetical protein